MPRRRRSRWASAGALHCRGHTSHRPVDPGPVTANAPSPVGRTEDCRSRRTAHAGPCATPPSQEDRDLRAEARLPVLAGPGRSVGVRQVGLGQGEQPRQADQPRMVALQLVALPDRESIAVVSRST